METNRGAPTPPIAFAGGEIGDRLTGKRIEVDEALRSRLVATGAELIDTPDIVAEASRDWWPLAMIWALDGQVAARARRLSCVRPTSHRCRTCCAPATTPVFP